MNEIIIIAIIIILIIAMIVFAAVMHYDNEAVWALVCFVLCLFILGAVITLLCFYYPSFKDGILWVMRNIWAFIVGGIILLIALGAGKIVS